MSAFHSAELSVRPELSALVSFTVVPKGPVIPVAAVSLTRSLCVFGLAFSHR